MELLNKFKDVVVAPCLEADEAYIVRSRKLLVIASACIIITALLLGIPCCILEAIYTPTPGVYVLGASLLQVTVSGSIVPYLYVRRTRKLPDPPCW